MSGAATGLRRSAPGTSTARGPRRTKGARGAGTQRPMRSAPKPALTRCVGSRSACTGLSLIHI
eukprot:5681679-Alexandrium_andersonii.AAC.1